MRSTVKRIIAFSAALLLAFGMIPGGMLRNKKTAKADDTKGTLTIAGTTFIDVGTDKQQTLSNGSVVYNAEADAVTITLNAGANISSTDSSAIQANYFNEPVIIVLDGASTIHSSEALSVVYSDSGFTIQGSGTLELSGTESIDHGIESPLDPVKISGNVNIRIFNIGSNGIRSNLLTISNGAHVIIEKCAFAAINCRESGSLSIEGATVRAYGGDYGIIAPNNIRITDSDVTAIGEKAISAATIITNQDSAGWKSVDAQGKHAGDPTKIPAGSHSGSSFDAYRYIEIPHEFPPDPTPVPGKTPDSDSSQEASAASTNGHDDGDDDDEDAEHHQSIPKTGDANDIWIWIGMVFTGAAVIVGIMTRQRRAGRAHRKG